MNLTLLQSLTAAFGVSGCEDEIRTLILQEVTPLADDVTVDALGDVIAHKQGNGPRLMFSAHMDSIGLMVAHIDEKGYLRFCQVGGLEPAAIYQTPVRFQNGVCGVISVNEDKSDKQFKLTDLFVDIGAKDRADAATMVKVGDVAAYEGVFLTNRGQIISSYLDNRAGCFVLLEALRQVERPQNDLYFVFSVQEEVGCRGARTAAWSVHPEYGIAVDVTCPDDVPGAAHVGSTAVGKGAAVKVMDRSVICTPSLVKRLREIAEANQIAVQDDILTCGGTDAGPMQVSHSGVKTGGISIPCRYTHAPAEAAAWEDIEACIALVRAVCESELNPHEF
ncbi:MAG: M42 family metallopeptidase [Clostridiales bacterium]|nr:M42 family metallopeptidase [Clostridiales bacterium]